MPYCGNSLIRKHQQKIIPKMKLFPFFVIVKRFSIADWSFGFQTKTASFLGVTEM